MVSLFLSHNRPLFLFYIHVSLHCSSHIYPNPFSSSPHIRALGVLGLGTAATTIFLPEVVFGSFAGIFAGIGSSHQDYRHRRGSGGYLSPGNCQNISFSSSNRYISNTSSRHTTFLSIYYYHQNENVKPAIFLS